MPNIRSILSLFMLLALLSGGVAQAEMTLQMANSSNPCAMKEAHHKNPCGMKHHNPCNPCGMKNPCGAKNPCATSAKAIDPKKIQRPAGTKLYSKASTSQLVKLGEKLFKDNSLSSNGLSCNSCHSTPHQFDKNFAQPYPHKVSMAKARAGLDIVDADEFVQFCLLAPMASKTLPWESKELAALTTYVKEVKQKEFIKMAHTNPCNPCGMKNPCAHKNPCGMNNPCAAKNPCSK